MTQLHDNAAHALETRGLPGDLRYHEGHLEAWTPEGWRPVEAAGGVQLALDRLLVEARRDDLDEATENMLVRGVAELLVALRARPFGTALCEATYQPELFARLARVEEGP